MSAHDTAEHQGKVPYRLWVSVYTLKSIRKCAHKHITSQKKIEEEERMLSTRMNCQQTARYNCCRWIASDAIQYLFSLFANCFYVFPFPVYSKSVCVSVRVWVFYLSPKVKCLFNGVRFSRIIESMWGSSAACLPSAVSFSLSLFVYATVCVCAPHIFFRQFCDKHAMASLKMSLRLRYITRV